MKPSPLLPLGPRILVRPDASPQEVRGVALPETVTIRPESGTIAAVSVEVLADKGLGVGDRVAFAPYSGVTLTIDGESFKVLAVAEVLGKYKGAPADAATA